MYAVLTLVTSQGHDLHNSHKVSHYFIELLLLSISSRMASFNLSMEDAGRYFTNTMTANGTIFTVIVLPSLLFCLLCAVALIFTEGINNKIRLLLTNIFVSELSNWLSYTVFYLTWPLRLIYQDTFTCKLFYSLTIVASTQGFMAAGLYATQVYTFTKHGQKKLKWRVVIPLEAVSWLVTFIIAALPYADQDIYTTNGFCAHDPSKALFLIAAFSTGTIAVFFLGIQIVYGILTFVFIKRNTLEENTDVKKAVAKVLAYFIISSILSLINKITPWINLLIVRAVPQDNTTTIIAVNYLMMLVFFIIPSMAMPFVTIGLLKPVRVAIKAMIKRACMCCRTRSVNN